MTAVHAARRAWHVPRLDRRRRLLALAGALLAVAVVLGGLGGVLLGFSAVLLALDAVLPLPAAAASDADERFRRVVLARRRAARLDRLAGRPSAALELLDDSVGWAASAEHLPRGVQPIRVGSVVGTVEPLKARAFDGAFRPDAASRAQWKRVWLAQVRGAALPPISVYRVGGRHFVRDGHHRMSVARELGLESIDADVVELVARRPVAGRR